MADITEDLYELLGVTYTATAAEIATAYRKKALRCHPDKFPGDAVKAALFLKLSKAYQVLTDPKKKADYDKNQKARLEKLKKLEQMDAKRRKLREGFGFPL